MIRKLWIISMIAILILGYATMIDDNGRINKYNKYSIEIPKRNELLYNNKYEKIEKGELYIEDMWYLMMTDVINSRKILNEEGFEFIDLDNISDSYRLNTNIINGFMFGTEKEEKYRCKIENDNSLKCSTQYNDTEIKVSKNDYSLLKENNKEITTKDKKNIEKFYEKIIKNTNEMFREYILGKYNCEYQKNCKNLKEANKWKLF